MNAAPLPAVSLERRIDAVLPLTFRDCERARILLRSLRLLEPLGRLWIVVPDRELRSIELTLPPGKFDLVPESTLIPQLPIYRVLYGFHPLGSRRQIRGTQVQQLIKLAIARWVETPFYLTLDADVICMKPVRYENLVRDGRALHQRANTHGHPLWYKWAERVLGLPQSGAEHGVTPALLSREAMLTLHDYLENRVSPTRKAIARLLPGRSRLGPLLTSWHSYLCRRRPFTEYSLYGTFLEATGLYDRYHVDGGARAIYSNCVWHKQDFDTWDPSALSRDDDSYFCVVQSTTGIDPARIAAKVASFIG